MGRYLKIADQTFSGIELESSKKSDSKVSSPTLCEKSELCEKSPPVSVHKFRRKLLREHQGELRKQAANSWHGIKADIGKLIALADLVAIAQIRESGKCPDTYTSETECKHCGPVPIFEGCPSQV